MRLNKITKKRAKLKDKRPFCKINEFLAFSSKEEYELERSQGIKCSVRSFRNSRGNFELALFIIYPLFCDFRFFKLQNKGYPL